jgi:hypothetical protein
MVFSVGSEVISPLIMLGSFVSWTSALVHKSTPKAAPSPVAIALIIVAAPCAIATALAFPCVFLHPVKLI